MLSFARRISPAGVRVARAALILLLGIALAGRAPARGQDVEQKVPEPATQGTVRGSSAAAPAQRIPRQQALTTAALDGVLKEAISPSESRPVAAAQLTLRNLQSGQSFLAASTAEGIFRLLLIPPGHYEFRVEANGYVAFQIPDLALKSNVVATLEISLARLNTLTLGSRLPRLPELGPPLPPSEASAPRSYRELHHRLDSDPAYIAELAPEYLPPVADVFNSVPKIGRAHV